MTDLASTTAPTLLDKLRSLAAELTSIATAIEQQPPQGTKGASTMIGKFCVIRTYSAGVHVGTLVKHKGTKVTLSNARRIWSWQGANTLHEIALAGVGKGSKISAPVESILLTEAIEIIPASAAAQTNLESGKWGA